MKAADNMKAFPPAEQGMVRYVLQLSRKDDEAALKVELIVGKTVQTDGRNRYFFDGKIEAETIKGWGYTRYKVNKLGPIAGTLMAINRKWINLSPLVAIHTSSVTTAAYRL